MIPERHSNKKIWTIIAILILLSASLVSLVIAGKGLIEKQAIGADTALDFACQACGIESTDAQSPQVLAVRDGFHMNYEVTFKYDGQEYHYLVSGEDGRIISGSGTAGHTKGENTREPEEKTLTGADDTGSVVPGTRQKVYLTIDQAKSIALENSGCSTEDAVFSEAKLNTEDGKAIYRLTFKTDTKTCIYQIDAVDGIILSVEIDKSDDNNEEADTDTGNSQKGNGGGHKYQHRKRHGK